jgi:hypothetical protein
MTVPSYPSYPIPPRSTQQQESGHYHNVVFNHHTKTGDRRTQTQNAIVRAARRINREGGRQKDGDGVNGGENKVLFSEKTVARRSVHIQDSKRVRCRNALRKQLAVYRKSRRVGIGRRLEGGGVATVGVQRLPRRTVSPVSRRLARFDASSRCRTAGKLFYVLCNAIKVQTHTVATHNDGVIGVRLKR